jgi:hypothetical protein
VAWCGFGRGFSAFVLAAATVAANAQAQEWSRLLPSETPERLSFIDRWEARAGFFDHDRPGIERKTFDLQGTIVTPRPRYADAGAWNMVLPRAQIGGFYNLSGRTSAVFVDALWTIPALFPLSLQSAAAIYPPMRNAFAGLGSMQSLSVQARN